jgi:CDP-glucose 4,6-dehydratase
VTSSYRNSFFTDRKVAISTARAGNVIGGGDFANDRIVPDCVRAVSNNEKIILRNPHSVRPYQHVLEPLFAYLMIAARQYEETNVAGEYNIGPDDCDCVSTGALADLFCSSWGNGQAWENRYTGGPHEAGFLKLDCSKFKGVFSWEPRWNIAQAVEKTVEWTKEFQAGGSVCDIMDKQIAEYLK